MIYWIVKIWLLKLKNDDFRNFTLFHLWHLGEHWIVVISRKNLMKMNNSFLSTRTWPIAYLRKKNFWNEKNELNALFLYYIFENGYILLTWEIHSKMRKIQKGRGPALDQFWVGPKANTTGYVLRQCICSTILGPFQHNLDRDIDPQKFH